MTSTAGQISGPGEHWYRFMVESPEDYGILSLTRDAKIVTWNRGAQKMFLYTPEEIVGRPGDIIFTPEDRQNGAPEYECHTAIASGRARDDRWHMRKDGTRFFANGLMMALRGDDGEVIGLVKIVQDRTNEKRTEDALRRSEDQFARILLGNPAPIMVEARGKGRILLANQAFEHLTGYYRSDLQGNDVNDLRLWPDQGQRQEVQSHLDAAGHCPPTPVTIRGKDGALHNCIATFRLATAAGEQCVIGTYMDITSMSAPPRAESSRDGRSRAPGS